MVLALGGSTNATLHIPAIASEAGIALGLDIFDELSRQTPLIAKFRPASPFTVIDLDEAGGIPAVLNILSPLLHLDLPTVTGETLRASGCQRQKPASRSTPFFGRSSFARGWSGHSARQSGARWRSGQAKWGGRGNAAAHGSGAGVRM